MTLNSDLPTPKLIGFLGRILRSYNRTPSLVKLGHWSSSYQADKELTRLVTVTLAFDLLTPKLIGFLRPILGSYIPSLVKLGHCKLKLSAGHGNKQIGHCDLDLWPSDPKIVRLLGTRLRSFILNLVKLGHCNVGKGLVKRILGELSRGKWVFEEFSFVLSPNTPIPENISSKFPNTCK